MVALLLMIESSMYVVAVAVVKLVVAITVVTVDRRLYSKAATRNKKTLRC